MDRFRLTTDWLNKRASLSPDTAALLVDGRSYSFSQLDGLVSRLCHFMRETNVDSGDHVGMLAPNSLAAVACVFALARIGAILVPLNTRLTPQELAWQIERSDCSVVLYTSDLKEAAGLATRGHIPTLTLPHRASELERVLTGYPTEFKPKATGDLASRQAIVFTSGTTGFPKGVMIRYANHYWSASGSAMRLGVHPDDRWLLCLPLYHVGGLSILFRSCLYGTAVVLHNGFSVEAVMNSLQTEAATLISLVPTMLSRLLQAGLTQAGAPSLRLILLGGAAASPQLLVESAAAGLPIAVTYGLTETTSQVATMEPERVVGKPGSAGKPLAFATISILDDEGHDIPHNIPGEIVVGGPMVMAGYYNDPAATSEKIVNGRLHTGDIGYLDDDGDLWVLDRRSDLIVSGGENVYPAELERVLREYPGVSQVCVVGLPHPDWGQQVTAIIVPHAPERFDENDLLAFSRERLAGYKQPRAIYLVDQLPQTGSGKINRRAAAEALIQRLASE